MSRKGRMAELGKGHHEPAGCQNKLGQGPGESPSWQDPRAWVLPSAGLDGSQGWWPLSCQWLSPIFHLPSSPAPRGTQGRTPQRASSRSEGGFCHILKTEGLHWLQDPNEYWLSADLLLFTSFRATHRVPPPTHKGTQKGNRGRAGLTCPGSWEWWQSWEQSPGRPGRPPEASCPNSLCSPFPTHPRCAKAGSPSGTEPQRRKNFSFSVPPMEQTHQPPNPLI